MATDASKKLTAGQFTHWARPKWIRMYSYNYDYAESYYRPLVRYVSTSRVASESTSLAEARQSYLARRRAVAPPRAQSYIERWASEPFYGYGFRTTAETRRARSEVRATSDYSLRSTSSRSQQLGSSLSQTSFQKNIRDRRAQSVEASATYASDYNATAASDDCLMRSTALDTSRYSRARSVSRAREQSYSSELEANSSAYNSRYARESSLTRKTLNVDDRNILRGSTLDDSYHYEYPKQHLVCTEKCPLFSDPYHHRRFVIGNRFGDAAALGGFDVLYDPTVFNRTRTLLKRCSEERDLDETSYQRASSSSRDTRSQSRYAYNTIY